MDAGKQPGCGKKTDELETAKVAEQVKAQRTAARLISDPELFRVRL